MGMFFDFVEKKEDYRNCVITRPPPLKLISKVSDGFGRLSWVGRF